MQPEPTIHVGIVRRFRTADGLVTDVTINFSGIPVTAGDELIRQMRERAGVIIEHGMAELEERATGKKRELNPAALDEPLPYCLGCNTDPCTCAETSTAHDPAIAEEINAIAAKLLGEEIEISAEEEPAATVPVSQQLEAPQPIPREDEVEVGREVFGIRIQEPPLDWHSEELSEINRDGDGGGQLKAVNTALGNAGFKGHDRHPAAAAILREYGEIGDEPAKQTVGSIRDLTKYEAHVVLDFFEKADFHAIQRVGKEVACLR